MDGLQRSVWFNKLGQSEDFSCAACTTDGITLRSGLAWRTRASSSLGIRKKLKNWNWNGKFFCRNRYSVLCPPRVRRSRYEVHKRCRLFLDPSSLGDVRSRIDNKYWWCCVRVAKSCKWSFLLSLVGALFYRLTFTVFSGNTCEPMWNYTWTFNWIRLHGCREQWTKSFPGALDVKAIPKIFEAMDTNNPNIGITVSKDVCNKEPSVGEACSYFDPSSQQMHFRNGRPFYGRM